MRCRFIVSSSVCGEGRVVAIRCPHCGHGMSPPKNARPGKYKPKCGKCDQAFSLTIPADASQPPVAEKLADSEATLAPATSQQTVVAQAGSLSDETIAPAGTMTPALSVDGPTRAD